MNLKYTVLSLAVAAVIVTFGLSSPILEENRSLVCNACGNKKIVKKAPDETFIVMLSFKNTGVSERSWSVNIAFESEAWTWSGAPQDLTLKTCHTKTLTWTGRVPKNAPIDSTSRLIVYYDSSFEALDWWILVVEDARLEITSSIVK